MTKEKLATLISTAGSEYRAEFSKMVKSKDNPFGLKPQTIKDFEAGYADGMRAMVNALRAAGALAVEE